MESSETSSKPVEKKSILLVDDDSFVCDAVQMMLTHDGHAVETAASGEEALKRFQPGKYDVVITDFAMPGIHGDKLALALREIAPDQPIVMLSAHGEFLRAAGGLPGVDVLVEKPFRLDDLRAAIVTALTIRPRSVMESGSSSASDSKRDVR